MAFWLQSVTSGYFTETAKRIELLFGTEAILQSLGLSYTALIVNSRACKHEGTSLSNCAVD